MLDIFESYLLSVDAKDSTRKTYRKALERFSNWMEDRDAELLDLCREDIVAYKDCLLSENKSSLTINLYLSALRGVLQMGRRGVCLQEHRKRSRFRSHQEGYIQEDAPGE